jgi:hypothetical protein
MASATVSTAETKWAKQNPPQITLTSEKLTLWNYPVGKSTLSDEFETAIANFLINGVTDGNTDSYEVSVRGHASSSGEGSFDNDALSQSRADAVGSFIKQLGYSKIDVSAAGASEPADNSGSGLAMARNRRVDITYFIDSSAAVPIQQQTALPPNLPGSHAVAVTPTKTQSGNTNPFSALDDVVKNATSFALAGKLSIPVTKGTLFDWDWTATFDLDYEAKELKANSADTDAIKALVKGGAVTAKFDQQLSNFVKGKFSFEPAQGGKQGSLKLGAQLSIPLSPELGFQAKAQFFYLSVDIKKVAIDVFTYNGVKFQIIVKGSIKLEFGPTAKFLKKLARWVITEQEASGAAAAAGLTGEAAATAVSFAGLAGGVVITLTILSATPWIIEDAKQQGLDLGAKVSTCDGAAAQVALEILGPGAASQFESRKSDFRTSGALDAFNTGVDLVKKRLADLSLDDKKALVESWKAAYAKDQSFSVITATVGMKLGIFDRGIKTVNVDNL